jgi:hypothetical protein
MKCMALQSLVASDTAQGCGSLKGSVQLARVGSASGREVDSGADGEDSKCCVDGCLCVVCCDGAAWWERVMSVML